MRFRQLILNSIATVLFFAAAAFSFADDPIPPTPTPISAKSTVTFPGLPPTPAAPVLPDAITTLLPTQLYVVASDEPFVLAAFPSRMVTITQESGPLKIRAIFSDGGGKLETRTYPSKFIAIVEAAAESGRVELAAVPNNFKDESDWVRRLVDIGVAPQPPPGPSPVDPVDPPLPTPTGFRVLMVYESAAKLTREQSNILHSTQITAFLNANCTKGSDGRAEWRKWDFDVKISDKESKSMVELWDSVKPKLGSLPRLVIAVNGQATIMDLPPTEAETLAKLKKMAGVQ